MYVRNLKAAAAAATTTTTNTIKKTSLTLEMNHNAAAKVTMLSIGALPEFPVQRGKEN